jgi:pSer/pThr/pTyr-binding forkhead associated (FHA) protein
MSVLRSIESKIESLFEGVFGRAFRSNVQPVELARKLVKEMDDHRSVSVSRVYVPNEYTIYLSPADREQFSDYEEQLREELQDYLAEHARRERYVLLTEPRVKLDTDEDLDVGVFGIATRLVRGERAPADAPPQQPEPGATMVYKPVAPPAEPEQEQEPEPAEPEAPSEIASITIGNSPHDLNKTTTVLGRSKDADIQIPDPNVSRRHAEVRRDGTTYTIIDLDSTNGIEVGGKRVKELVLEDGARLTLGSTEVVFSRRLA